MYLVKVVDAILYLCFDDGLKTVLKVAHSTLQYFGELLHHPLVDAIVVGARRGETAVCLGPRRERKAEVKSTRLGHWYVHYLVICLPTAYHYMIHYSFVSPHVCIYTLSMCSLNSCPVIQTVDICMFPHTLEACIVCPFASDV